MPLINPSPSSVPGAASQGAANTVQLSDGAGAFLAATGVTVPGTGRLALAQGTITTALSPLSITETRNAAGVTFPGLVYNVTDTASAAASLMLNLQVGGTSRLSFNGKSAVLAINTFDDASNSLQFNLGFGFGYFSSGIVMGQNGSPTAYVRAGEFRLAANAQMAWSSSGWSGSPDLVLLRDGPNTLAQRNGTAAQTYRHYGTWTDASNGRWLEFGSTTAGVFSIRPTGNGTGASGNVLHISGLPTSNPGPGILWNNAGSVAIGT